MRTGCPGGHLMGTMMLRIGTRVRVLDAASPAFGRPGTVLLATTTGDGYLVEVDRPFPVSRGFGVGRQLAVSHRRGWFAAHELEVDTLADAAIAPSAVTRRGSPPPDLREAHLGWRHHLPAHPLGPVALIDRPMPPVPPSLASSPLMEFARPGDLGLPSD